MDKWHHLRGAVLLCVLLLGFAGVAIRLVHIQIVRRDFYVQKAAGQHISTWPIKARRGGFFDRAGRSLCVSVPVKSVFVVPKAIKKVDDVPQVSLLLSRALSVDEAVLRNGILRSHDKKFMWVKRLVSEREAARVRRLELKCVKLRTEYRRVFPRGVIAPHVIGWVDIDQKGKEGLERVYESQLTGDDGLEVLECDGRRSPLLTERAEFKPVVHGNNVRLTLDADIQRVVSGELDKVMDEWNPLSATIIVMEVKTGRILALGNRPTFSPMYPGRSSPEDRLNRAVCCCYEPGSIFKPFVMAGFLQADLGRAGDTVFCENGLFRIRGRRLRDHHPFGWLTYSEVMEKSSNVGMAKVGLQMGPGRLFGTVNVFGFGETTGSGMPGEIEGIVTPFRKWTYYTVTSVPMGQEIAATPMQLVTAFNAVANGGVLVKPQVVDAVIDAEGKVLRKFTGPKVVRRVASPETARVIIDPMMTSVVRSGTGKRANAGQYVKFGKSGTAQKVSPRGGFAHSRFVSSFICGGPAEDPKVTVLVLLDEPRRGHSHYGGTVAAPAAGRIVEKALKHLHVPPRPPAAAPEL